MDISDRTFRVLVIEEFPWVMRAVQKTRTTQLAGAKSQSVGVVFYFSGHAGYFGPIIEFWSATMEDFPGSKTVAGNASAISDIAYAKFPQSVYSAAVFDVGVGTFDAAISNFYITKERLEMTRFLPAMGTDDFYLVVEAGKEETSFAAAMQGPFLPFSWQLWLACAGWAIITGDVNVLG